ncbi:MAG: cyclic nucleotide-binding/CBS domain-containing protein [Candidatus Bathyarchaeia archaeon]
MSLVEAVLLVRDVMTSAVKTARPDTSILDIVRKMNRFDIGSIVVVQGERPVGIITERDILREIVEPCLDPTAVRAREVMSTPLITIDKDVGVEEAARLMARRGVKRLPVVQGGRLVGIVTTTDLVKSVPSLMNALEELVPTRRPPE